MPANKVGRKPTDNEGEDDERKAKREQLLKVKPKSPHGTLSGHDLPHPTVEDVQRS